MLTNLAGVAFDFIIRPLGIRRQPRTIACDLCGEKVPLGRCMALHLYAQHAGDREAS